MSPPSFESAKGMAASGGLTARNVNLKRNYRSSVVTSRHLRLVDVVEQHLLDRVSRGGQS